MWAVVAATTSTAKRRRRRYGSTTRHDAQDRVCHETASSLADGAARGPGLQRSGLARAGLVAARKDGRFIYYSAHFERMNDLVGYLTENCCSQGAVCAPVCAPNNTIERKRKSA
jgi:hypothetical protein